MCLCRAAHLDEDGHHVGRPQPRKSRALRGPSTLGDIHREHAAREGARAAERRRLAEAYVDRAQLADVQPKRRVELESGGLGRVNVACKRSHRRLAVHPHHAADGQGYPAAVAKVQRGRRQLAEHAAHPTAAAAEQDTRRHLVGYDAKRHPRDVCSRSTADQRAVCSRLRYLARLDHQLRPVNDDLRDDSRQRAVEEEHRQCCEHQTDGRPEPPRRRAIARRDDHHASRRRFCDKPNSNSRAVLSTFRLLPK